MNERDPLEMFNTIYGEVARYDCYGLQEVQWKPTLVVDIGANVGAFSMWASLVFPEVTIFAVEPDEWNIKQYRKHTANIPNCRVVQAGLGDGGPLWKAATEKVGGNQSFLPAGNVRSGEELEEIGCVLSDVPSMRLGAVLALRDDDGPVVVKIDCEGAGGVDLSVRTGLHASADHRASCHRVPLPGSNRRCVVRSQKRHPAHSRAVERYARLPLGWAGIHCD